MEQTELAYLAGILDGEGSIFIAVRPPRDGRSPSHTLTVVVKMRDPQAVELFQGLGGTQKYRHRYDGAIYFVWQAQNKVAFAALVALYPYLRVKKHQAEIAIQFYNTCIDRNRPGLYGGARKLTGTELDSREVFRTALHDSKKENYICQKN